ncbi:SDR family oxidoreductase [Paraflavitalea pollutisoli]|uniref:SDR family oxidoreductase n=1 Tax=Paraflavitalea pollutisoli TaxID=3034143 RepID=UPI0023ECC5F5|nr:NAD(P)H-binding protein [Paraflavitalea sp. H1-2-19X]
MKKILVIGGTGMIGQPVTRALIDAGFTVSLLARDPQKAEALFPDVHIIQGDVFDPLSLMLAFEGQDAVYISLSPPRTARPYHRMPEREGIDNIIAAAQRTGIKRIALLSSLVQQYNGTNGFRWWIFDIKLAAVQKIRQSGIPYTIFYPSTFMESFDQLLLVGRHVLLAGHSQAPMYFIAADDYARQVARSFQIQQAGNHEYAIQGPAAATWQQGAADFIQHYPHKRLRTLTMPLGMFKLMGRLIPLVDYGAKISEALNKYPERFDSTATWNELGKPVTTIAAYAAGLKKSCKA